MQPPFNALYVFQIAARLSSFTGAADKLGVTQPAISRQIQVLENLLNVRLFERGPSGIRLTAAGQDLQHRISPAFKVIEDATQQLRAAGKSQPLRLRVYTTFAAKWLIERLPSFRADYPGILLEISSAVAPVDFQKENVDVAIQFGNGQWPAVEAELLFRDLIQPVCSPSLLKVTCISAPDDLRKTQMLHSHYRRSDWADWLQHIGRLDLMAGHTITFPSSVLTYQAATKGVGVAVGQLNLLRNDLRDGTLVKLLDMPLERPLAHYAVWPKGRPLPRRARNFLGWLHRRVDEFRAND